MRICKKRIGKRVRLAVPRQKSGRQILEQEYLDWILEYLKREQYAFRPEYAEGWAKAYLEEHGVDDPDRADITRIADIIMWWNNNMMEFLIENIKCNGFDA